MFGLSIQSRVLQVRSGTQECGLRADRNCREFRDLGDIMGWGEVLHVVGC